MLFTQVVSVGIDLSKRRPTYAALDLEQRLFALGRVGVEEMLAFLSSHPRLFVALNAPPRPNQGLIKRQDTRSQLSLPPLLPDENPDLRLADYLLRQSGFQVLSVPAQSADAPAWMQRGFDFYACLEKMGYRPYPADEAPFQWLETNSQATFSAFLKEGLLLPRYTLEGRLQRQLILYEQGVLVIDPMDFFEEVTRRKLLHGSLPIEMIYTPEQLDALAAAHLAWRAALHPDQVTGWGEAREGIVYLPANSKKKL